MAGNLVGREIARLIIDAIETKDSATALGSHAKTFSVPFSNILPNDWKQGVRLWLKHGVSLIKEAPPRDCPICRKKNENVIFESHDGYPFTECVSCGCWYVPYEIDNRIYERFFANCEEARQLADQIIVKRLKSDIGDVDRARLQGYFNDLKPITNSNIGRCRYLDVGCNVGHSVKVAAEAGFEAYGVDANEQAVAIGRERGLDLYTLNEELPAQEFGIISFWETLEHMVDPLGEMKKYRDLLSPGGVVALTVPNLNSIAVKLQRGDCPYVHGGRSWAGHINWFNINGIKRLLEQADLEMVFVDGQYSHNLFDMIAYLLGESHGVGDLMEEVKCQYELPEFAVQTINALGPAMALLERLTITSPIFKVFASKVEDRNAFEHARRAFADRRNKEIVRQARKILS